MINTLNISPLRYPGGKTRACKIIDNIILKYFNLELYDTLISPFFGGGSFEFYFQNKYKYKLIVNDKFCPLYNFWKQIKTNKELLYSKLNNIKSVSKSDFSKYRKTILQLNDNMLEQAIQYFLINRCSFSGATLSGGFSEESSKKRYTKSSIDRIQKLNFNHIDIFNLDFEVFINNSINDSINDNINNSINDNINNSINDNINNYIIFLDPPYYLNMNSKLYGNNGDMHETFDHERLYNVLKTKQNWLITYNNCDYIRKLYKDYIIIDVDWKYGMNKTKKSSEIIILYKSKTTEFDNLLVDKNYMQYIIELENLMKNIS